MEMYLRVNLLEPGPRLMKKEFTGPRSHKGWETLVYSICSCSHENSTILSIQNIGAASLLRCNFSNWLLYNVQTELSCVHNFMFIFQHEPQYLTSFYENFFMPHGCLVPYQTKPYNNYPW